MANAISFTSPYDAELDALKRREALALAMQQQSDAPLSGTMAGGRVYVPPSWAQGAAKLAQAWAAKRGMDRVDERRTAIANERQSKLIDALTKARQPGADVAGELMANPDTAGAGLSVWQNQVSADTAAKAARELEELKQQGRKDIQNLKNEGRNVMTPYQEQQLRMRQQGLEVQRAALARQQAMDYFNTGIPPGGVPGAPAAPVATPAPAAPVQAPAQPQPAAASPLAAEAATPGAVAPPAGLSPKAQQDYLVGQAEKQAEANRKKLAARPKDDQAFQFVNSSLDRIINEANAIMKMPGLSAATGTIAGRTPSIRQSTVNVDAAIKALGAKLSIQAINDMRAASKTGGAVGQVTEKEWPRLEAAYTALDQAQDTETYKKRLGELVSVMQDIKSIWANTYKQTYGELPQGAADIRVPTGAVGGGIKFLGFEGQ